jgi:hypothetical protein
MMIKNDYGHYSKMIELDHGHKDGKHDHGHYGD